MYIFSLPAVPRIPHRLRMRCPFSPLFLSPRVFAPVLPLTCRGKLRPGQDSVFTATAKPSSNTGHNRCDKSILLLIFFFFSNSLYPGGRARRFRPVIALYLIEKARHRNKVVDISGVFRTVRPGGSQKGSQLYGRVFLGNNSSCFPPASRSTLFLSQPRAQSWNAFLCPLSSDWPPTGNVSTSLGERAGRHWTLIQVPV
ncbi:hypothetical protein H4582DRAFT_2004199 [Lactarius indigo]|nr:hypothetical protein H4582DRAFT_2004199 [Lactarius indigo]